MFEDRSFLGRGWGFPPQFNKKTKTVQLVEAEEDINQSLEILLSTSLGERVLQPNYGCNLQDFQFEPMSASMIGYVRDIVENAILYHEPRIKLERLNISKSDGPEAIQGILKIEIDYLILSVNSRFNFVYDFYVKEGIQDQI